MTRQIPEKPPARLRTSLVILAVLGLPSALLAAFLWQQLLVSRAGGTPACGFGEEGACGALWDSAFASTVHRLTGVPVAGWGLVWGFVALLLPLLALARPTSSALRAGIRWVALGGVLATVVLAGVSVAQGIFCLGCVATYALSLAYAGVAFRGLGGGVLPRPAAPGLGWALGATALVFLVLLLPGLRTPQSATDSLRRVVGQTQPTSTPVPESQARDATSVPSPPALGDEEDEATREALRAEIDRTIRDFVLQLDAQSQQVLADALYVYRNSPIIPAYEPRVVLGPQDAPIRITDFTDVLCPACAELHASFEVLEQAIPSGTFTLEPRHFPLDGRCNSLIPQERPEPIRCLGAKALICLEQVDEPGVLARIQKRIFEAQQRLDETVLYSFTDPHIEREDLQRCMESAETKTKLEDDIRWAELHQIQGTPLVLLNGRKASSFGPFLYVILLNRGNAEHPAFNQLPPPGSRVTG